MPFCDIPAVGSRTAWQRPPQICFDFRSPPVPRSRPPAVRCPAAALQPGASAPPGARRRGFLQTPRGNSFLTGLSNLEPLRQFPRRGVAFGIFMDYVVRAGGWLYRQELVRDVQNGRRVTVVVRGYHRSVLQTDHRGIVHQWLAVFALDADGDVAVQIRNVAPQQERPPVSLGEQHALMEVAVLVDLDRVDLYCRLGVARDDDVPLPSPFVCTVSRFSRP